MRALECTTGHVIYNSAYTYKFQLKTTIDHDFFMSSISYRPSDLFLLKEFSKNVIFSNSYNFVSESAIHPLLQNYWFSSCLWTQLKIHFVCSMVKRGCPGDASILKPTIMAAVPLMLDRIYKAINEKVNKGSPFTQKLFNWAYEYRYN